MRSYKCLKKQEFSLGDFKLVPIREEDKELIRQWRNEQIYHLRQAKPLTYEDQQVYFQNVVSQSFTLERPNQILFSFLENDVLVAYGGLVHINWIDKHAEISFLINTTLEKDSFEKYWLNYLTLLEKVAFEDLQFHKIFTYAYDLRPHLYTMLKKAGFKEEARLKEHCFFDGKFIDVLIHGKFVG